MVSAAVQQEMHPDGNMPTALEAKDAIRDHIRLTRPHVYGMPLVHSDKFAEWHDDKLVPWRQLFTHDELEQLMIAPDPEACPHSPSDFYDQSIAIHGTPEEAILANKSSVGAASALLLTYSKRIKEEPLVRRQGLDPLISARARVDHLARVHTTEQGRLQLRKYDRLLGHLRELLKDDISVLEENAWEFVGNLRGNVEPEQKNNSRPVAEEPPIC